jgi:hypothetical protein
LQGGGEYKRANKQDELFIALKLVVLTFTQYII